MSSPKASSGQAVGSVGKLPNGNVAVTVGSVKNAGPGLPPTSASSATAEFTPEQAFQFALLIIKHSGKQVAVMDLG